VGGVNCLNFVPRIIKKKGREGRKGERGREREGERGREEKDCWRRYEGKGERHRKGGIDCS